MSDLKKVDEKKKQSAKPRNYAFIGIAAAYLIYLGYELCMGYINKNEGSGIGFFTVGIVFIGVGITVVIYALKESKKRHEMLRIEELVEELTEEESEDSGDEIQGVEISEDEMQNASENFDL